MKPGFIADANVGRLARRLRMMGYDTLFINDIEDSELIRIAYREKRIILTRDTGIMERRIVAGGDVSAVLIEPTDINNQVRQVVETLNLEPGEDMFSRCMECNDPLIWREKESIRHLVPQYVYQTQDQFMQCPVCERIYWQGTHWEKMVSEVEQLKG